jgi:hypothetical protein
MRLSPDIAPIVHISPYRRIDPSHPGRKMLVTRDDINREGGREPDLAVYHYNAILDRWTLKDGM